ncbi:MAG: sialate O-acetylesterase [Lentisphaeria bacterium]
MRQNLNPPSSPVTIDAGLNDWQILQQNENGVASITLRGTWWTVARRKSPQVLVRIVNEDGFSAISRTHDWTAAETRIDKSLEGEDAGKRGKWELTLRDIPCGGPYRVETSINSAEDALEWRRVGDTIHFLGVGDIWLIAGQSNAEGYGRNPVNDPPEIGIHQLSVNGKWELAVHANRHHPWLAFAKNLRKELGYPIGLIPTAVGGSPVSRWDPQQDGDLFENMEARVKAAGGKLKGALWYQGESDTGPDDFPQYKTRFSHFLRGLRDLTGQPQLPIITVQLNRHLNAEKGRDWDAIREAQRQLSHELDNVFIISCFESVLCDGVHNGSLGNLLIAQRTADTALGGIYGKDIAFRHPECAEALQVEDKIIQLRFANVVTRLDYTCDLEYSFPFAVRDEQGDIPVAGYSITDPEIFHIELERPPIGHTIVTGAPGACPPHVIPKDIDGYRGMLGFSIKVVKKP